MRLMFWRRDNKQANKRSRRGGKGGKNQPWNPRRTLRGFQAMGLLAVVIAVILLWQRGQAALESHVAQRSPSRITADHIDLINAPTWMSEAWRNDVKRTAAKWIKPDPFDGRSLAIAAEALREDPLIEAVHQVRRVGAAGEAGRGRVRIAASYREPVAVAASQRGYHLVDAQGVVLPRVYQRRHLAALEMIVIVGARSAPPLEPGGRWRDRGVKAGLRLAQLIRGEPFEREVEAIDVSHRAGRYVDLYLLTHDGPVRWGRPPGREHAVEPDAEVKLKRLRHLADRAGSIALPGRLVEINGPTAQSVEIHLLPESARPRPTPTF